MLSTPRLLRLATHALAFVALAACGSSRSTPAPAATTAAVRRAADELPPCTATVAGADLTSWREVSGPGFRLCVPGTWALARRRDTTGSAGARWASGRDRAIEWRVGPFGSDRGAAFPYNQREERALSFDGRPGQLSILTIQGSHSMFVSYAATAGAPALRLSGHADGAAAKAELLTVFQSLQGPAAP